MADITKCKGVGCPVKEDCYRYTAEADIYQAYFLYAPYDKEKKKCDYYWGNNSQSIFEQIEDIIQ
jgi:hypothetical protein